MNGHNYNLQFEKLLRSLGLGLLKDSPTQVFGGHLHRMYSVNTTSGKYAIKALNPQVMLRKEAKMNIINSEKIAQIASKYISASSAKIFESGFMPEIDGQYYLVFDWIDGKTIYPSELTTLCCQTMGSILSDIHKIDFSTLNLIDNYYRDEASINWHVYLNKGIENKAPWVDLLSKNIDNLFKWNNRLIQAAKKLDCDIVISHGDLDPKNVMWRGKEPIIIDWEAAGFINPMQDLVETALYWSVDKNGKLVKDKFTFFIAGYKSKALSLHADWPIILDKGFGSKLGWLEYSLKRSLGIEGSDKEDQRIGSAHVSGTIQRLHEYECMRDSVIELLEENL